MNKNNLKYLVDALLFICMVGLAGIGYLQGFFLAEGPVEDVTTKYFLGLHTHQWGHIHFYISLAFSVLIVIHLILSWNWIKACSKRIFKNLWGAALVGMVIVSLLIPLIFWAFALPHADEYAEYGTRSGRGRNLNLPERQVRGEAALSQTAPPVQKEESTQKKRAAQQERTLYGERAEHEEESRLTRGRLEEQETGILITGQMTLYDLERETGISKSTLLKEMGLPANIPSSESLGRLKRRYNFTMQELRDKIEELLKKERSKI